MKGYEGHSVVVAEQVVKADESHSVGVPTKETNLASCAGPPEACPLAHEARFVSFVGTPTEWDSSAFMAYMGLAGENTRFIDLKQPFAGFFTYM